MTGFKRIKEYFLIIGLLTAAFLMSAPLRQISLLLLAGIGLNGMVTYLLVSLIDDIVLFFCLLIMLRPCFRSSAVVKSAVASVLCGFFDILSSELLFMEIGAVIYQVVKPIYVAVIIIALFRWSTGCKPQLNKGFFIASGGICAAGLVFALLSVFTMYMMWERPTSSFFEHLWLLNFSNNHYANLSQMTLYVQEAVVFLFLMNQVPTLPKPPARERQALEDIEDTVEDVPDGYWRCMGCGEILDNSRFECSCGYKR